MHEILNSRAYSNLFFTLAKSHDAAPDLPFAMKEWYLGSRMYCFGLANYASVLGELCLQAPLSKTDQLEDAFVVPLHLAAEEFSMGKKGGAGAHYRIFTRLAAPLGLNLEDFRSHKGELPETKALVDQINEMLSDPYRGAACVRVFELVGLNICKAFGDLCSRMRDRGAISHTTHQKKYVDLHLAVEPVHEKMAIDFIANLIDTDEKRAQLLIDIDDLCCQIGKFWDAVAVRTFCPEDVEKAQSIAVH